MKFTLEKMHTKHEETIQYFLSNLAENVCLNDFIGKDWDVYKDKYSAENVMRDFDRIFLS